MTRACSASPLPRLILLVLAVLVVTACSTAPPRQQGNLCDVFDEFPGWYDDAMDAQERWGTPAQILMAIIKQESGYRSDVRPERDWFLFIPLPRDSSAYGYAQAQDPIWEEYKAATGGWFKGRDDMEDALDFVGWYTDRIHRELGISRWDPEHLYIAYHDGIGGYRRGNWRHDSALLKTASRVDWQAREYGAQLRRCR